MDSEIPKSPNDKKTKVFETWEEVGSGGVGMLCYSGFYMMHLLSVGSGVCM